MVDRCFDRVDSLSLRRTANPAVTALRADAISATIQEVENFRANLDVIDLTPEMQATMKVYGGGKIWAGTILVPGGVWTKSTTTVPEFGQVMKVSAAGSAAVRWTRSTRRPWSSAPRKPTRSAVLHRSLPDSDSSRLGTSPGRGEPSWLSVVAC